MEADGFMEVDSLTVTPYFSTIYISNELLHM